MAAVKGAAAADAAIFRTPVPRRRPAQEWETIVARLRTRLADFLEVAVEEQDHAVIDAVALSCTLVSAEPDGPLQLRYRAMVGLEVHAGAPSVTARLFVSSTGLPLGIDGDAGSHCELVYRGGGGRSGRWRPTGWQRDVYEEFQDVWP